MTTRNWPEPEDDGDRKTLADIKRVGWAVLLVEGEEEHPEFAYSVGLFESYGVPEVLVIGLKHAIMHSMINDLGTRAKEGHAEPADAWVDGLLEGHQCFLTHMPTSAYREYLGYACWFYRGLAFPCLQCIWPTTLGIFPWQAEWPIGLQKRQPILDVAFQPPSSGHH